MPKTKNKKTQRTFDDLETLAIILNNKQILDEQYKMSKGAIKQIKQQLKDKDLTKQQIEDLNYQAQLIEESFLQLSKDLTEHTKLITGSNDEF